MKRIHASSSWSAALYVSGSMPTETASYCRSSERESRESAVCFLPTYMPGATISVTANGGSVIFPCLGHDRSRFDQQDLHDQYTDGCHHHRPYLHRNARSCSEDGHSYDYTVGRPLLTTRKIRSHVQAGPHPDCGSEFPGCWPELRLMYAGGPKCLPAR